MKIDTTKLKKINWYRQGGATRMFYVMGPYHCVHETLGWDRCVIYQEGDINTAFFDREAEAQKTRWALGRQMKDKSFIDRWIADWEKKNLKVLDFYARFFRKDVYKWSDRELALFLSKSHKLSLRHWMKGVILEWTDPDGLNILNEIIKSHGVNLTPEEVNSFIAPEQPTFNQAELMDRIEIAKKAAMGKDVGANVQRHADKYFWLNNTWSHVEKLDADYFVGIVAEDIKKLEQRLEEAAKIKKYLKGVKREKANLLKQKRVPRELENIFYMFTRLTDWRDYRKKMAVCLPNYYLWQVLERIRKENALSEQLAAMLLWSDIKSWKLSMETIKLLRRRRGGTIYICSKDKHCAWFYGPRAKKLFQSLIGTLNRGALKGVTANKGKAAGRVKIIETKKDFAKMKEGDILVATMTRPEYVPLMKIAGAIVTNEGGVTCHAAIVSRELGIPCVIGTQVATEVLKDGDMVEVDADKGVVRKI